MFKLRVAEDYKEMSAMGASEIAKQIIENPKLALGLSAGSTPIGTYQELIKLHETEKLDFSQITTFNLDEYVGLESDHPQSFAHYMWNKFLSKVNIQQENVHFPSGILNETDQTIKEYEQKIKEVNGIDIQILGVGQNGHIGFNEPNRFLNKNTHIETLTDETIKSNARFFNEINVVPKKAITMGIGNILETRKIIFMAYGSEKAYAVKKTLNGKITTEYPSSFLQLHPDVTVILDKEAAKFLSI